MMGDGLKQKYENPSLRNKRIWRPDNDGTETLVISVTGSVPVPVRHKKI
jgi:hypothetical protein